MYYLMQLVGWVWSFFILYVLIWTLPEIIRALWWSVWTLYPVAKNNPEQVTLWNCIKYVAQTFWDEFYSAYDVKRSAEYSHEYWPWNDRDWFIDK